MNFESMVAMQWLKMFLFCPYGVSAVQLDLSIFDTVLEECTFATKTVRWHLNDTVHILLS